MDKVVEWTTETIMEVGAGFELQPGDVVELRVEADGSSSARVIAYAGTPEAEAWRSANSVAADLEVNPA